MVTLQILVLSFQVRILVAQQRTEVKRFGFFVFYKQGRGFADWLLCYLLIATLNTFPLHTPRLIYSIQETSLALSQKEGTEGRECKYSWELTDLNGEAEAEIPLKINIFLFPQPHY